VVAAALAYAPAPASGATDGRVGTTAAEGVAVSSAAGTVRVALPAGSGVLEPRAGMQVAPDVAVRTGPAGAQLMRVLHAGADPSYRLDLPAGVSALARDDGGLDLAALDGRLVVGEVGAPWAVDAAGTRLPTSYTLHGTELRQHVDTREAAFPVVADPSIAVGRNIYLRYSNFDVKVLVRALNAGGAAGAAAAVCTGTLENPACLALVAGGAFAVDQYLDRYWNPRCGIQVTYPYTSLLFTGQLDRLLPSKVENFACAS
jgi:hypothetical protein